MHLKPKLYLGQTSNIGEELNARRILPVPLDLKSRGQTQVFTKSPLKAGNYGRLVDQQPFSSINASPIKKRPDLQTLLDDSLKGSLYDTRQKNNKFMSAQHSPSK